MKLCTTGILTTAMLCLAVLVGSVEATSVTIQSGGDLNAALAADGASDWLEDFHGQYIYDFDMQGGGGYHSHCNFTITLSEPGTFAIGVGKTDAGGGNRVVLARDWLTDPGIQGDPETTLDLNGHWIPDWQDATYQFSNGTLLVTLNSKWGSGQDSYIRVWLSTYNRLTSVDYTILDYTAGFHHLTVTEYENPNPPIAPIPEPATMLAGLAGLAGIGRYLRRRK